MINVIFKNLNVSVQNSLVRVERGGCLVKVREEEVKLQWEMGYIQVGLMQ